MNDNYSDIRPYTEEEALEKILQIVRNQQFISALQKCVPDYSPEQLLEDSAGFNKIYDFQYATSRRFIDNFLQMYTSGVVYNGFENYDDKQSYLLISNHRDITFDAAVLSAYLFSKKLNTVKIAIGDNLLSSSTLSEVAKLNKMFIVKRSLSNREKIMNFQHLSAYIHHVLFDEHESVWIAQRDGRTKDGFDVTKQGLVKMLAMDDTIKPLEMLKKINLTPLTISYEYEPCDKLKAREMALSETEHYQKKPGEDFESILQGIFGFKGRIELTLGTTIRDEIDTISTELNQNDRIYEVCKMVDQQIYRNYKLFPNNYIAFDILSAKPQFCNFYTEEEKLKFQKYLDQQSDVQDVSKDKMMYYLLRIYANPVTTSLGIAY